MTPWAIACAHGGPIFHSWGTGVGAGPSCHQSSVEQLPGDGALLAVIRSLLALTMTGEWLKPQSLSFWPVP